MQQLISTTTALTVARNNLPTPRSASVTSWFHGEEPGDIYIPNETLHETEPALPYGCTPARIKPKAPSTDTLCNKDLSCTAPGKDNISHAMPQRHPLSTVNPFGFSDYPPNNYYDHPQPCFHLPHTSHCKEDS
uniref:Uncharacterized protein n=1 Tax=Romanomermis culicivorax TaxID=13658 RepID=A0A915IHD2_ROMCU